MACITTKKYRDKETGQLRQTHVIDFAISMEGGALRLYPRALDRSPQRPFSGQSKNP